MTEADHSRWVETLSGLGLARGDIAQILRLTVDDLNQKFSDEIKDGPIKANSRVAEELTARQRVTARSQSQRRSSG